MFKKHLGMMILGSAIVLALLLSTVVYAVDELSDIVVIKTFGKITDVKYGSQSPGLHFKLPWPFQRIVRYDSRWFTLEAPYMQTQTKDEQALIISVFCSWRIAEGDAKKFHERLEFVDQARKTIRKRLQTHQGNVFGQTPLSDLLSTDPKRVKLREVEQEILDLMRKDLRDEYGIEIRLVGVKAWGLPQVVSDRVIDAQKSERENMAKSLKAAGEAQAKAIRSRAEAASKQIVAFAEGKAASIRSGGYRAAAELYSRYRENPELAKFLRTLESLRKEFKSRTMILLDGSMLPTVRLFKEGLEPPTGGGK